MAVCTMLQAVTHDDGSYQVHNAYKTCCMSIYVLVYVIGVLLLCATVMWKADSL